MVGAGCRRYTRRIRAAACTRRMQGSGRTRMSRSIAVGNERRLCDRVSMARARSSKTYAAEKPIGALSRRILGCAWLDGGGRRLTYIQGVEWTILPSIGRRYRCVKVTRQANVRASKYEQAREHACLIATRCTTVESWCVRWWVMHALAVRLYMYVLGYEGWSSLRSLVCMFRFSVATARRRLVDH